MRTWHNVDLMKSFKISPRAGDTCACWCLPCQLQSHARHQRWPWLPPMASMTCNVAMLICRAVDADLRSCCSRHSSDVETRTPGIRVHLAHGRCPVCAFAHLHKPLLHACILPSGAWTHACAYACAQLAGIQLVTCRPLGRTQLVVIKRHKCSSGLDKHHRTSSMALRIPGTHQMRGVML